MCGTNFLFPVVPDVNSTNTSSVCVFGSVEKVVVFFFVAIVVGNDDDVDGCNEKMPHSPGLGTNPIKGIPNLSAHCSIFLNTDQSRPLLLLLLFDDDMTLNLSFAASVVVEEADVVVVISEPLYGPITSVAPHRNKSASNSLMAPLAVNGTQLAQCDVANIANANSDPLGNTNAIRSPFPNPNEWSVGPKSCMQKSCIRSCVIGARPSMDANAGCDCCLGLELVVVVVVEEEEGVVGMAEQNVGKSGRMAEATSRPTI
jgi:hypothetical protein